MGRGAIACPDIKAYGWIGWRLHGADFQLCPRHGFFSARWRQRFMRPGVRPVSAHEAPPYLLPRLMYSDLAWSTSLRGWGASEASVVLKSFFMGIDILHIAGPLARHRFQKTFPYETTWDGVWRNQAIITRVCFDDDTWFRHWMPQVFDPHLSEDARHDRRPRRSARTCRVPGEEGSQRRSILDRSSPHITAGGKSRTRDRVALLFLRGGIIP